MLFGYAGESDASKTVALYQKGCDLGGQYACANLAFAVSQGMGTGKQDIAKGLRLHNMLAITTTIMDAMY